MYSYLEKINRFRTTWLGHKVPNYLTKQSLIYVFAGEADGETGVVSKAVERAVLCRKVQINGAEDFFTWCQANLTKDEEHSKTSKRDFVFVKKEDILRNRPGA